MEPMTLKVDELIMRPWELADVPALTKAFADPQVKRHMMMPQPWTDANGHNFVRQNDSRWNADSPRWAIVDSDNILLGGAGITRFLNDEYSVMYWTAPEARGRNVATRALREATRFGFDQMRLHRLCWDAIVGNHLSRLVALKAGYTMEGIQRQGGNQRGTWRDLWMGGILAGEIREAGEQVENYAMLRQRAALFDLDAPTIELDNGTRLRPFHEGDLDDLTRVCQDPEVQKWTTVPRDYQRSDADDFLTFSRSQWTNGTGVDWALADQNDRYCGTVGLSMKSFDATQARIGYYAAPWARGKGWMGTALQAAIDFSRDSLAATTVTWDAYAGNDASWHLAKKLGFAWEGVKQRRWRHERSQRVDIWTASLLHLLNVMDAART
ncbi:GNAT family N-acetyltransferase [Natronoglycomyces albus]|uniref:GNAT family N-acetyltransferase n=1 Tax=Natronoglycomyces albus TaxID=2811108 RepID=A0A895XNT1_9ACTN|nr:GNAT family N-acetyltransferase [Natronoglycomyces albus]QSB04725.1 GNAT family N-acetyltransferase [Natronoglycomyces albus]